MQAADLFAGEEQTSEANKCRLKVRPSFLCCMAASCCWKSTRDICKSRPGQATE